MCVCVHACARTRARACTRSFLYVRVAIAYGSVCVLVCIAMCGQALVSLST